MPLGASTPIPVITTRFRLTMMRLRRGEIPSFYLRRFLNKLTVENGRASGVHQKANSNVPTKCSHYIFHPPCPSELIHKFSLIHKIDLACRSFLFHPRPSPAALLAR